MVFRVFVPTASTIFDRYEVLLAELIKHHGCLQQSSPHLAARHALMAGQNVSGWSQDALGVWHEDEVAAESEVTGVSDVAEWRDRQGSGAEAHGYALPSAIGMPISGLPRTDLDDLDDPAALALVVPEVVVPEHATCLGALLNGGMSCSPHFVPGKVHFQNNEVLTLTLTLALTLTLTLIPTLPL